MPPVQPGDKRGKYTDDRLQARRAEAWTLYCRGWTQRQLSERYGVTQSAISHDLKTYRESMPPVDREEMRRMHLDGTARIKRALHEIAERTPAPMVAGKDGLPVTDPVTGEYVRDYSARMAAYDRLLKVQEREAKLMGLDAAAKVEHSGEVAVVGSIEQEIARLAAQLGVAELEPADTES